jgi:hypothetical protein
MKTSLRFLAVALACCALFSASAQTPPPGFHIDVANLKADWSSPQVFPIGGWLESRLAQTLTVKSGGYLAGIFVPIYCGTGTVTVEVRDVNGDWPGPNVIGGGGLPASAWAPGAWTFIPVWAGSPVSAGDQIAIVLSNDSGECAMIPTYPGVDYRRGKGSFETIYQSNLLSDFPATGWDDFPFALVLH